MKRFLALASLTLLTSTATAADVVIEEAPPIVEVAVGDWTGFYAGVQLGGAFGDTDELDIDPFTDPLRTAFTPAGDPAGSSFNADGEFNDGFVGGVHVGYDQQFSNNVVLGAILDVSYYDISDEQRAFSRTPATYEIERELDFLVTARARLGYVFTPRVMGYVTGGLAYGELDFSYRQPGSAASFETSGDGDNFGYTVGAGIEGLVTDNVSLGLEYLYTNLGDNDFEANLTGGPFGGPASTVVGSNPGGTTLTGEDEEFDFHTVQLKLSYRF